MKITVPVVVAVSLESLMVIDEAEIEVSALDAELRSLFGRQIVIRPRPKAIPTDAAPVKDADPDLEDHNGDDE